MNRMPADTRAETTSEGDPAMKLGSSVVHARINDLGGIAPTLLLVVCGLFAGAAFAQTNAESAQAIPSAKAQRTAVGSEGGVPNAKSATPTPEQKLGSSETTAKGTHEGIQVHGYWTIEVRNPDGTVTAHREFENAVRAAGQDYLESLLTGQAVPGGMAIALNGADITAELGFCGFEQCDWTGPFPQFTDPGPCLSFAYNAGDPTDSNNNPIQTGGPSAGTTCLIVPPVSSGPVSWLASLCIGQSSSSCGTNLSTQGLNGTGLGQPVASPFLPLTLSGSITVASTGVNPGTVNDVETLFVTCPSPSLAPSACENLWKNSNDISALTGPQSEIPGTLLYVFTMKTLDGQNGDPAPVPYQLGQTIAVTVQISFQ